MNGQLRLAVAGAVATCATALSLHTVFEGWAWFPPVVGGILLVVGATSAVRGLRLPSVLQPLGAAVVILAWITFLDARAVAVAGFIPGPGAFRRLRVVARSGVNDVHRLATPVPTHRGVVLLALLGVAAVALVVDLMVVQLRRVALAGLPLLGLFATCAGVGRHGAGIIAFIAAASGYLWLLFVDSRERVTRWGTSVRTGDNSRRRSIWSDAGNDPASVDTATALGRRIGGAAIGLGVVIPLLIPGLHTGIGHRQPGGGGSGGDDIVTVNPIVSIASDLQDSAPRPVLTYRTSTANPGYLRMTSLDSFDGRGFSASALQATANARVDGRIPDVIPPTPTATNPTVTTTVTVSNSLDVHWLPVEAQAASVRVDGDWRYDQASGTIFSASDSTSGVHYTAESVPVDPTARELAASGHPAKALAADLGLPRDLDPRVRRLTHQITKNAGTQYAAAVAIQDYLGGGHRFLYDTTIPQDNSPDALADFLLHTRRGFCQQFATAMAVMARIMGIPARVAVGFTRGTRQADGSWLVTTADAHAWPELWFQGVGWVPFEPTPRGDGQAVSPIYTNGVTTNPGNSAGGANKGSATDPLAPKPRLSIGAHEENAGNAPAAAATHAGHAHHGSGSSWLWLVLLAVAVALTLPGLVRVAWRRHRRRLMADPATASGAAWAELRAVALDMHAPWDDQRSPRQAVADVASLVANDREARTALARIARAEEESRYARDPQPGARILWSDVDQVADALQGRLRPAQRWRFRVFPRSLLLATIPSVTWVADRLDDIDRWISRSRRRLRRPA